MRVLGNCRDRGLWGFLPPHLPSGPVLEVVGSLSGERGVTCFNRLCFFIRSWSAVYSFRIPHHLLLSVTAWLSRRVLLSVGLCQGGVVPSPLGKKAIIILVRADPGPYDFIPFQDSQRLVVVDDPNRIEWPRRMDGLEPKAWVVRIPAEDSIRPDALGVKSLSEGRRAVPPSCALRNGVRDHNFAGLSLLRPLDMVFGHRLLSKLSQ